MAEILQVKKLKGFHYIKNTLNKNVFYFRLFFVSYFGILKIYKL